MADRLTWENVEKSIAQLSPQEQMKLIARISERLSGLMVTESSAPASLPELQRMEAEWVTRELEDFVRLIQRYRALYITAIFLAVGWTLGQAASAPGQTSIETFRQRPDVAALLCVIPLLNVFLVALGLEAYHHMKTLARYRFILGFTLGGGMPAWRWERWRETPEGSTQSWTGPLNILSSIILIMLTASSLWFPFPAVRNSQTWALRWLWAFALLTVIGLVVVLIVTGIRNRGRNAVADPPSIDWSSLWPPSNEGNLREGEVQADNSPKDSETEK